MKTVIFTLLALTLSSCSVAPVVRNFDRQTVMEAEAAGEWPEFGQRLLKKNVYRGPSPLPKVVDQKDRKRAMNIIHGEMLKKNSQ